VHLLIDTDPGMGTLNSDPEDSFAVALAANSPEVELVGLTVVQGNVPLRHGYANARHVLKLLGRDDVTIAAGADQPIMGRAYRREAWRWLAEKDGWSRLIPVIDAPYPGVSAVEAIRLAAESYDDLVIAAIGPLTNIALAIRIYPHIVQRIRRLVVMGGTFEGPGNITPGAEFNFFMDPEAARIVLDSPLRPTLVGLDVCHRTRLTAGEVEAHHSGSPFGDFVRASCAGWLKEMERAGRGGLHLFDSLAVAEAIRPGVVTTVPAIVQVNTSDGPHAGATASWYAGKAAWSRPASEVNAEVAVDFDAAQFAAMFEERVLALL
jgi:inosine-uridine nucleoside N-ribohydrolase